ncbi:NAD(P)-binding protein [Cyanobium sp. Morenito 9A2]|nr:NAD(P)-binding protein [Cyanobium sp. Morenito 9A2]
MIGAGVSGCALLAQLRRLGWTGELSVWETGRSPGGRASTRRSRRGPGLRFDHGAPLFNISSQPAPELLAPLLEGGWIEPWPGTIAQLDRDGQLQPHPGDRFSDGQLFRGRGGMDQLCQGLLHLAGARVERQFGTLVRHLVVTATGRWHWLDGAQQRLGEADWLVLSGTLLAHPRSRRLLGWDEPPLQPVARRLGDPQLDRTLAAIAALHHEPRCTLLLPIQADHGQSWRDLPFRWLSFDPGAQQRWDLERLSIQPFDDGRCAVVAHATAAFASKHLDVFGSGSTVAGRRTSDPTDAQEEAMIRVLSAALQEVMERWISPSERGGSPCQLMRWGAALAQPPGLFAELMLCPQSRIGFCGDGFAGPGFGRLEGALRSSEALARQLMATVEPISA